MGSIHQSALDDSILFKTVLSTAIDGIIVIDETGIVRLYSAACERLFGYRASAVIGQNVSVLMPSPYRDEHDRYLAGYRNSGIAKVIGIGREITGRREDGSLFPMQLEVGEARIDDGRVFIGVVRDLTSSREEAERHKVTDRLLAQIVESSDVAILSKTLDGVITSWNLSAERIFGYRSDEAIGQHISMLIPPDRMEEEDRIIATIRAGKDVDRYETVRRRKDGQEIFVALAISPIHDSNGRVVGASKMVRDISEEREKTIQLQKLQSELTHVTRLSLMGEMTAAIAHELNQPLAAVTNYINAAKHTLTKAQAASDNESIVTARDFLADAGSQALRAGSIIRNLRDFLGKRESDHAMEDINAIVRESVSLTFVPGSDSDVVVDLQLGKGLEPIWIDKIQIQQVLVNFIRNAIDAMSDCEHKSITIRTGLTQEGAIEIVIADSGPGLTPEVKDKLFAPFITTKQTGMGMGLPISRSIIQRHGGDIELLESVRGAVFRITLPYSTDEGEFS